MALALHLESPKLLDALIRDVHHACASGRKEPRPTRDVAELRRLIAEGGRALPLAQVAAVAAPLAAWIEDHRDELPAFLRGSLEGDTGAFYDLVGTLAQRARREEPEATAAFEEVVSDLYDGFLSAQDRRGVQVKPDAALPPLVRWGSNPDDGPYTWPVEQLAPFGVRTGVVVLPRPYARGGLAGWATLGHETCGHDVLNGFPDLMPELRRRIARALEAASVNDRLVEHWMRCFEEAASDVMGALNLGPTAALADAAFFLGWNGPPNATGFGTVEDAADDHPIDLLRIQLGASVVRGMRFAEAEDWAAAVDRQWQDHPEHKHLRFGHVAVPFAEGRASAAVFARTMTATRLRALDGMSLGEIQNWRDADQERAGTLAVRFLGRGAAGEPIHTGASVYAAHVLAGALMAVMSRPTAGPRIFPRFRATLATLNEANPMWTPGAMVKRPGDVVRRVMRRPR